MSLDIWVLHDTTFDDRWYVRVIFTHQMNRTGLLKFRVKDTKDNTEIFVLLKGVKPIILHPIRLLALTALRDFINPISEMIENFLTVNIVLSAAMYIHAFVTSIRIRIHAAPFGCLVTRSTNDELITTHCMGDSVNTVSNNGFMPVT